MELTLLPHQHYLWSAQAFRLGDFSEQLILLSEPLRSATVGHVHPLRCYRCVPIPRVKTGMKCPWEYSQRSTLVIGWIIALLESIWEFWIKATHCSFLKACFASPWNWYIYFGRKRSGLKLAVSCLLQEGYLAKACKAMHISHQVWTWYFHFPSKVQSETTETSLATET